MILQTSCSKYGNWKKIKMDGWTDGWFWRLNVFSSFQFQNLQVDPHSTIHQHGDRYQVKMLPISVRHEGRGAMTLSSCYRSTCPSVHNNFRDNPGCWDGGCWAWWPVSVSSLWASAAFCCSSTSWPVNLHLIAKTRPCCGLVGPPARRDTWPCCRSERTPTDTTLAVWWSR